MAITETKKLCNEVFIKFSSKVPPSRCCNNSISDVLLDNTVKKVLVVHRIGNVAVSEASILIAVTTPHRELGLNACQFLIDSIKKSVPIWKKELLGNGKAFWK
ncbi:hypothetical protein DSO57_1011205 [Entomophthora muscae]|uniref:Uncharacterized protein n=1 Tax=Entomophthora muscae TaxID=34485 RepID=A0ACC2USZ3_9FUNG|nr:hypothetical protein DSO57_1011205 [Entomophthora muscae]